MKRKNKPSMISRSGRKYLSADERTQFIDCVREVTNPEMQTFALTLTFTGCRLSEALALRACDVDLARSVIYFKMRKRRSELWREVPISDELCRELEFTHRLKHRQLSTRTSEQIIWRFSRTTAYRRIVEIMKHANIKGPQATPRGLRHGFGVAAVEAGVPLPTVAAILGHSDITTTTIYTTAAGAEAREFLEKIW